MMERGSLQELTSCWLSLKMGRGTETAGFPEIFPGNERPLMGREPGRKPT